VLALLAGGFAAVQSDRANESAARAVQAAVAADARRVGARSQLTDDISLSLLLAAAGARLDDSPETRANLVTALAAQPLLVRSARPAGGFMEALVVSPDGRWVAASDDQNRMHLYDASTNRLLDSYDDAATPATDEPAWMFAAFSPDSRTLAVGLEVSETTEPVRLLDPTTMDETTPLAFPDRARLNVSDLQFSADGHHLAAQVFPPGESCCPPGASDPHGHVLVWDLRAPDRAPERVATGLGFQGIALSPDGRTVYTSRPLTAYDVASGAPVWRRRAVNTFFSAPEVNASGTLLALGETGTRHALLVDARTGRTVTRLRGHREEVGDIRFSPDGSRVGAVSWGDEELIVWDTATGRLLHRWDTTDPYGVGFGPDNDLVHGGGADSLLRSWDVSLQETYLRRTTRVRGESSYEWAQLSPDGQRVAYRWVDGRGRGWVRFVDIASGRATPPTRLPAWRDWWWIPGAWDPQGEHYAGYCCYYQTSAGQPGAVSVLDADTGRRLGGERDVVEGGADATSIAYVDDGRSLLVGDAEGRTTIVDADTLRPSGVVEVQAHVVTPIGDGSTAMLFETSPVVGGGMPWRLVDLRSGDVTAEGHLDHRAYASVASPDGSTVATAGETGEVVTIDVSTGTQRRSTSLGVELWSIAWSDDGERLVSGAQDGGVSLWDAATLDLLGTVRAPHDGDPVAAGAQFIGDSHDVVIASYDGTIYRWDTDLDRALEFACQMAGRDLTEEEWAQYLPAQPYRSVCPDVTVR
jgi:WD40 repeat protein